MKKEIKSRGNAIAASNKGGGVLGKRIGYSANDGSAGSGLKSRGNAEVASSKAGPYK